MYELVADINFGEVHQEMTRWHLGDCHVDGLASPQVMEAKTSAVSRGGCGEQCALKWVWRMFSMHAYGTVFGEVIIY